MNHYFLISLCSSISLVFHIASLTLLGVLALICLSSTFPDRTYRLRLLGSGLLHDATASLGRRVLRLWLLITLWRRPLCCAFQTTSITTLKVPRLGLPSTLISIIVPVSAPVLALIPALMLITVLVLVPAPASSLFPSPFSPFHPWCPVFLTIPHPRAGAGSCAKCCWLPAGVTFCPQRWFRMRKSRAWYSTLLLP